MNKKIIVTLFIILALTALVSGALLQLPQVTEVPGKIAIFMVFATSITQILAVILFLSTLSTFKRDLKFAFLMVAAGVFILSALQLVPTLTLFVTIDNLALFNGLYIGPYILGGLLIFAGLRTFAKLLDVRDRRTAFPLVLGCSLLLACIAVFLPHPPIVGVSEPLVDTIMGSIAWCGGFSLASVLLALRIRRMIGPIYKSAMLWFALAMMALTFTTYHELVVKLYFEDSSYTGDLSLWPFLLTGILFLQTGLAFRQSGRQFVHVQANASPIDVVITMSQLISNPAVIDPELDKIRAITAQGKTGQLSTTDRATIQSVYLAVEDYLLTKEPLRSFTREELRADLPAEFLNSLKNVS